MRTGPSREARARTRQGARPLSATTLSQFVRLEGCERFLWFARFPHEPEALRRRWRLTFQPLPPLLRDEGARFEQETVERLRAAGWRVESLEGQDAQAARERLCRLDTSPVLLAQVSLEGELGGRLAGGRADLLRLCRDAQGRVRALVADVKASWKERVEHRLQVAFYARLLEQTLSALGLPLARLEGAVLHREAAVPTPGEAWPTFDLTPYLLALEHLVDGPEAPLSRVETTPFGELDYQLSYKCDGCLYNALCMYDSAERGDLALIPFLQLADKRALRQAGIRTLRDLAELKTLPPPGDYSLPLPPAPGREALARELSATWPVGAQLDRLVMRARRVLRRFDRNVQAWSTLPGAGFGSLPDDSRYPDLVKVFLDAQRDELRDRLYLVGALVHGPGGEVPLVRMTAGPPDDEAERVLLADWLADLFRALVQVAGKPSAPVHLYLYDRYDQQVLLEALRRHLDVIGAFPALFDLFTSHAALSQPMVSFLAEEVRERANLDLTCQPLHSVAGELYADGQRFDWTDGSLRFYSLFRARLFDNRRPVRFHPEGRIEVPVAGVAPDDPLRVPIESASRFNSQIPLEYAYGAWGLLPGPADEPLLRPFRAVTVEQIRRFQEHRLRALAHIERSFTQKNRQIDKKPLDLPRIALPLASDVPLKRALIEFLYLEHHARVQEGLQRLTLPLEQRVASGRALLLECLGGEGDRVRFRLAFDRAGLDPTLALHQLRLREDDWVVVNCADTGGEHSPWALARGRLGRIVVLQDDQAELELMNLTTAVGKSPFAYPHAWQLTPEPGRLYSADPMLDDLNGDKLLAACSQAERNTLYQAVLAGTSRSRLRLDPSVFDRATQALATIRRLEASAPPTTAQAEVIGGHLDDQVLLVQGPPGTGKSHTLGWAVLARLLARGGPLRVAVSSKTHNAVGIVLASVAEKWARLRRASGPPVDLEIVKLDGDGQAPLGVAAVSTSGPDRAAKAEELRTLLAREWLVVGGTSGGLANLLKRASLPAQTPFDLVVIDEASQMTVPEALLACAGLRPDGQVIVVGDHRQMPPILAHPWDREAKRSLQEAAPYRSAFEFLRDRGFPCVALDESFRLHRVQAEFLDQHVYRHDGIRFFSRREQLLPAGRYDDPLVAAVLDPAFPIVVVEHGDRESQQVNVLEVELAARIVQACLEVLRLEPRDGLGVVVPHRAQKAALCARFPELAAAQAIDTVERFQGGERDVIVVCATASDPAYVAQEADFLLNPNRFTVAISRPRRKLVVLAASSVLRLVPAELEQFEHAALWKALGFDCARERLWTGRVNGIVVAVHGRSAQSAPASRVLDAH